MTEANKSTNGHPHCEAVIIGAGFAGMYMLHKLLGLKKSVRVIEAGSDVGGTWYWNRYPGARCDVESIEYQYSFSEELAKEWVWTERYAAQPEIQAYCRFVADRLNLRPHITFDTRVAAAHFDEAARRWTVRTDTGETITAQFLIAATGCLSVPLTPAIPGLDTFEGRVLHTGNWPDEPVDFTGRHVAVIGTGSSGVQVIPRIAEQAETLHVFQRTPTFSIPAFNAPVSAQEYKEQVTRFGELKADARKSHNGLAARVNRASALDATPDEREQTFEDCWTRGGFQMAAAFSDLLTNEKANDILADFVRRKISSVIEDPKLAEKLIPQGYPCATKRLCLDTNYFQTYNRANVTLVDLKSEGALSGIPTGIRTGKAEYPVDDIILATGFDALTGALSRIDIRGCGGEKLADSWAAGPSSYLGLGVTGFPNLLIVAGPGSPSVFTNVIMAIEQQVEWIADLVKYMDDHGIQTIQPTKEAEEAWVEHVNTTAMQTLFPKANSWYWGSNVPGKPRVFLAYVGGLNHYRTLCQEIADTGYKGFQLESTDFAVSS